MGTLAHLLTGLLLTLLLADRVQSNVVKYLDLAYNQHYSIEQRFGFRSDELDIFCYRGEERQVAQAFRTIKLRLRIATDAFEQYEGHNPAAVREHYEGKQSLFSWATLLGGTKKRELRLDPFNQTCLGIETSQSYRIELHLVRFDLIKIGMCCAGIWLFLSARRLTKMPFFYYTSGVGLGVSLSVFLIVWMVSKQLPKKSLMVGTLVGGWALLWYFMQMAWDNARALAVEYQIYIVYYICGMGLISFIACYRIGPPTNPRSIDIVQWTLQVIAVALIFMSSQYPDVPLAIIIAMVGFYYFPRNWFGWVAAAWRRRFPPKLRLLTIEEYEAQGRETTRRELDKMMEYCSSPEAKPWRTVSRLKDPKRFAEFIDRGVHLTEEEVFDHEQTLINESCLLNETTDDSDSSGSGMPAANRAGTAPEISDDEDIPPPRRSASKFNSVPSYGWAPAVISSQTNGRPSIGRRSSRTRQTTTPTIRRNNGVANPEISSDDD